MSKTYCRYCEKEVEYELREGVQESLVKGAPIQIQVEYAFCKDCGGKVFVASVSESNLNQVDRAYRSNVGKIQLDDIQRLLKRYNIGAKPLSLMLNWGECTILRYLKGQLPDKEHNDRLVSLWDPEVFSNLYAKRRGFLTGIAQRKVERALEALGVDEAAAELEPIDVAPVHSVNDLPKSTLMTLFNGQLGDRSGNKAFQMEKFEEAVLFLSQKGIPLSQLNFCLWMSDVLHFRRRNETVFGMIYRRYEDMAAPLRHFWVYGALAETHISLISLQNECIIQGIREPRLEVFNDFELEILKTVKDQGFNHMFPMIANLQKIIIELKPLDEIPFSLALKWLETWQTAEEA